MKDSSENIFEKVDSLEVAEKPEELQIEQSTKIELLLFLKKQIELANSHNELRLLTVQKIKKFLEDSDFDSVQPVLLIKLLEVLEKSENEKANSLISLLKQPNTVINNVAQETHNFNSGNHNFTKEEYQTAKNILDHIEKIKDSDES